MLLFAIAFAPFYIIAHIFLGQPRLLGKSLFLALWTISVVGAFASHMRGNFRRLGGLTIFALWFAVAMIVFLRFLRDGAMDLTSVRFPVLVFVYGSAALPFVKSSLRATIIRRLIFWGCVLQALIGVVHSLFFPNLVTGIQIDDSGELFYVLDPGQGGFRESGTLISANTFGIFLVFGLILLFAGVPRATLRSSLRIVPVAALLWWGIALSGSRYSIGAGALVTAYYVWRCAPRWAIPVLLPFAAILFFQSPAVGGMRARFASEGSGGRTAILTAGSDLALARTSNLLLGATLEDQFNTHTNTGQIISDNSYLQMVLTYGLPVTLLLVFMVYSVWTRWVTMKGWVAVTALTIVGQFAVTNALYWDPFLLYAGALLLVVDRLPDRGSIAGGTESGGTSTLTASPPHSATASM
jgi:hypothetical protein